MALRGRGTSYTRLRGVSEGLLARAFTGAWPAHVAHALGWQRGVRVVQHDVTAAAWPASAPPMTIAFASDFHAGPTTHERQLAAACDALAAASPDIVLLGGDFVLFDAKHIDALAPHLARLSPPLGKFAVMGNHDLWADDRRIVRALVHAGVRVLVNESVTLAPPFDHVAIVGLDEPWTGTPDADAAFACDAPTRILLMHSPDGLLHAGAHSFDLALCGHTHGGHIALPFGVPIIVPGPLGRRHAHGRFDIDGRTLVVSRGVGGAELPFRTFAPPDVIVCRVGAVARST